MKNNKKSILAGTLVAGAILGGISLTAQASNLFQFEELGNGAEVRSQLLNQALAGNTGITLEMKCGATGAKDSTTAPKPADVKKDGKSADGKCGDGKCGDDKKKDGTTTGTKSGNDAKKDGKTKDGKCGDGKCGN
ncbi:hypothetical protein BH09BAC1_BH09BAC1_03990 [soil metagenome]